MIARTCIRAMVLCEARAQTNSCALKYMSKVVPKVSYTLHSYKHGRRACQGTEVNDGAYAFAIVTCNVKKEVNLHSPDTSEVGRKARFCLCVFGDVTFSASGST